MNGFTTTIPPRDPLQYLQQLGIPFKTYTHPAVYTCEEAEQHYTTISGIHAKNLFLTNKKNDFFLVILPFETKLDFAKLKELTGTRLEFANEKCLQEYLGVTPGSVSPFGLINDMGKVTVLIDQKIWGAPLVAFHPNTNTQTIELKGQDFKKYLASLDNKVVILP